MDLIFNVLTGFQRFKFFFLMGIQSGWTTPPHPYHATPLHYDLEHEIYYYPSNSSYFCLIASNATGGTPEFFQQNLMNR